MSTAVLRTVDAWWVETVDGAVKIDTTATTTRELLADRAAIESTSGPAVPVADLALLSPVTAPCRVVAQMVNYRSHAIDSGINPDTMPATFFRKTSGSISGPTDDVRTPAHVRLLDYEVELGLVFGADFPVGTAITEANLADYLAGFVITNDVSARDVQLPKTQFYEGKSYPTFTPIGPRLVLVDAVELARLGELRLRLWVNGDERQNDLATEMIVGPVKALQALSLFQAMQPGDLLMTGTPGGCALQAPPRIVEKIGGLLPTELKWKTFFKRQAGNPKFLSDGDVMELAIGTDDGSIDLGRQRTVVRGAGRG